jgi:hypothetical protein
LDGEAGVLGLFKANPFPGVTPNLIRFAIDEYQFSDIGTWIKEKQWWQRKRLAWYLPAIEKDPVSGAFRYVRRRWDAQKKLPPAGVA